MLISSNVVFHLFVLINLLMDEEVEEKFLKVLNHHCLSIQKAHCGTFSKKWSKYFTSLFEIKYIILHVLC